MIGPAKYFYRLDLTLKGQYLALFQPLPMISTPKIESKHPNPRYIQNIKTPKPQLAKIVYKLI